MPNSSFIEFILRAIPEGFLFILAVYALSKTKIISSRDYIISSIIFTIITFLLRFLPTDYGIHTILGIIFQVLLASYINKINIVKSIQASILSVVIMFIAEGINVAIIRLVLKKDLNVVFANPLAKSLYGIPSLLIFACIVCMCYFKVNKRK